MQRTFLVDAVLLCMGSLLCAANAQAQITNETRTQRPQILSADKAPFRPDLSREAYDRAIVAAQRERERYKGITVKPHPQALGVTLDNHKRIGAIVEKADFVPAARLQRFRWVVDEMHTPITGWHATILDAAPVKGGFTVTIKVTPKHDGNGSFYAPNDYMIESYAVSAKGVQFLGWQAPATRGVVVIN